MIIKQKTAILNLEWVIILIRKELESLKDEEYKNFSEKLLPGISIIGVRLPVLRKLSKKITLEELTDNTFEEIMLQGMIIGNIKNFHEFKDKCIKFLPKIDNWSVCDSFVSSLNITNNNKQEMFEFLNNFTRNKEEFIRRFVIVMYLRYFIDYKYIDDVLINLKKINLDGYYVEMAYAWCLAEVFIKTRDKFYLFLKEEKSNLTDFIIKKTISKIKESKKTTGSDIIELNRFMEEVL